MVWKIRACSAAVVSFAWVGAAQAGSLTAQGAVTALTNQNQMGPLQGTATFDDVNGNIPGGQYTPMGMTLNNGSLMTILPGSNTPGNAQTGFTQPVGGYFPAPQNGGVATTNCAFLTGVATFTGDVTQFGMTASRNGQQFVTVWNKQGAMIGQVTWTPNNDSSFIGLDTQGVPIGMLAFGNDDLWNGASYDLGGSTNISDTWVWALGPGCQNNAQCDDGDMCNGPETCDAGLCVDGVAPDCDDNEACTDDTCDPASGCVATPNQNACDDGDMCTENNMCADGACNLGTPVDCDDGVVCTADMCDPLTGCANPPIDGCCTLDQECGPDMMCDLDMNTCVPLAPMSTGEMTTTGDDTTTTTTGETTDGTTTGETTEDSTSHVTHSSIGSTSGEPTSTSGDESSGAATGSASNSGTGDDSSGGSAPTSGDDPTGAGDETGFGSSSGTDGVDDGDGCGCRTDRPAPTGLLLLGALAWIRRRRAR